MTLLVAAMVAATLPTVPATAVESSSHVQGELLVGFARGANRSITRVVHQRRGAMVLKHFEEIEVDLVRLPPGRSVDQERFAYQAERSVLFAEPNGFRSASGVTPNDPSFADQWGLTNTGQTVNGDPGSADADIDASEPGVTADAWQVATGTVQPIVAVIDTGVQISHPDLSANIWTNPGEIPSNGVDDDANGYIDDVNGWDFANGNASVYDPSESCAGSPNDTHGTHVSGILGATGNNAIGVAGVNWNVRIMPLKFLAKVGGNCGIGSDADAIEAILYATKNGAQFINASWGGTEPTEALRQAFIAAGRAGVLFAAAAGNDGADLSLFPDYPASFDLENEIVVAASNNNDGLGSFSNFGSPTDLAAPGVTILSTIPDGYAYFSGTSMATPFVTGALALLRSQYPNAPPLEIKDRVLATVDLKPAFATPITASGGRLNLNLAIRQDRPVVPTLVSPNGGEQLLPGSTSTVTWETHIPSSNPATGYRIEFTTDALAATTLTEGFESAPPGFAEPIDSEAPWTATATASHPGGSGTRSARSGQVGDNQASWLSTTRRLVVTGTVSFWYRLSSENCESLPNQPVCGDYLRFFIDGAPVFGRAGVVGWTQLSFPVGPGTHEFSWAYQKDELCPGVMCVRTEALEDAVWIDDLQITGIDGVTWTLEGVTPPGATATYSWTVPNVPTTKAKVRVCQGAGSCQTATSDESDEVFEIRSLIRYTPLVPERILDTRDGTGTCSPVCLGPLGANQTRTITVRGQGGVPTGVSSVVLNVTVTNPTEASHLTVYPSGEPRPNSSNLNYTPGLTIANLVKIKLGADGKVIIYNIAGTTDVIFDVAGWYSDGSTIINSGAYTPLFPTRIVDTRDGTGGFSAALNPLQTIDVQITGSGPVPAPGVSAVAFNLTAVDPTGAGHLTAWPTGEAEPNSSNLNFVGESGTATPNLAIVKVSSLGKVSIKNGSPTGSVHVIIDVAGWYNDNTVSVTGGSFGPLVPTRILDTRNPGFVALGPGESREIQVTGVGGAVPLVGAAAVVMNVTAVDPSGFGHLTLFPSGGTLPIASNLNFRPGQTVPNLVIVRIGNNGKVTINNGSPTGTVHVIFDVAGWFATA